MLRRERAAVENENRGIGDAVSENAIALSKRSAMFLKLAAPMLSPAAIQFAMKQNMDDLFDLDDEQGFPQAAARVIQSVQADQHLLKTMVLDACRYAEDCAGRNEKGRVERYRQKHRTDTQAVEVAGSLL